MPSNLEIVGPVYQKFISAHFCPNEQQLRSVQAVFGLDTLEGSTAAHFDQNSDRGGVALLHPLSGTEENAPQRSHVESAGLKEVLKLAENENLRENLDIALWRFWKERANYANPDLVRLGYSDRRSRHGIWHGLDIALARAIATSNGSDPAILTFSIGPVQSFISSARTLRDLWSGSYLLAWLTFSAMHPIIEQFGPSALIFPSLRGNPLADRYLRNKLSAKVGIPSPSDDQLVLPCIPNRFMALIPWGNNGSIAREVAEECEASSKRAWRAICNEVKMEVNKSVGGRDSSWDQNWDEQIGQYFTMQAFAVRDASPPLDFGSTTDTETGQAGDENRSWAEQLAYIASIGVAKKLLRVPPDYSPEADAEGRIAQKCSLLGTVEQMGPAGFESAKLFWNDPIKIKGSQTRSNERLSAIGLVKRFAWPSYFANELGLNPTALRKYDTATIASILWLEEKPEIPFKEQRSHWSGQWIYRPSQYSEGKAEDEDPVPDDISKLITEKLRKSSPPSYYAIVMVDGDNMGRWIRGEFLPEEIELSPAIHIAISEALSNFSLHFVPRIVDKHRGDLIYAGGDDVMALLPTRTALQCAHDLRTAYREEWSTPNSWGPGSEGDDDSYGNQSFMLMGPSATVSAGVAVVHYKEDLRFALDQARKAEKSAKTMGRDALKLTVCRRSGEHSSALLPWDACAALEEIRALFASGVSDSWTYKLRSVLPDLEGFDTGGQSAWEAAEAELRRLIARQDTNESGKYQILEFMNRYRNQIESRSNKQPDTRTIQDFVTLCQSASFLERGRDD